MFQSIVQNRTWESYGKSLIQPKFVSRNSQNSSKNVSLEIFQADFSRKTVKIL